MGFGVAQPRHPGLPTRDAGRLQSGGARFQLLLSQQQVVDIEVGLLWEGSTNHEEAI